MESVRITNKKKDQNEEKKQIVSEIKQFENFSNSKGGGVKQREKEEDFDGFSIEALEIRLERLKQDSKMEE